MQQALNQMSRGQTRCVAQTIFFYFTGDRAEEPTLKFEGQNLKA